MLRNAVRKSKHKCLNILLSKDEPLSTPEWKESKGIIVPPSGVLEGYYHFKEPYNWLPKSRNRIAIDLQDLGLKTDLGLEIGR